MRAHGMTRIEATDEAEEAWVDHVRGVTAPREKYDPTKDATTNTDDQGQAVAGSKANDPFSLTPALSLEGERESSPVFLAQ